jgi:NTE family protein
VSFNAVLLKELRMIALLRQVADPGNSEGAQRAGMRIHRIANEMPTELGASSKPNAEWADKIARLQHAIFGLSFEKGEGDQLGHRLEIWLNGCDPTALGASA